MFVKNDYQIYYFPHKRQAFYKIDTILESQKITRKTAWAAISGGPELRNNPFEIVKGRSP